MASPAVIYFAGITTVVAAMGAGFGGALMFTSTQPVHKEPAAGFTKREAPTIVETAPAVAAVPHTERDPLLIPAKATTAEEVAALNFAPPQIPAAVETLSAPAIPAPPAMATTSVGIAVEPIPDPNTINSSPKPGAKAPQVEKVRDQSEQPKTKETESSKARKELDKNPEQRIAGTANGKNAEQKSKNPESSNKTSEPSKTGEISRKSGEPRKQYVERRRKPAEDDEGEERASFAEQDNNSGGGFLGFFFGR